MTWVRVVIFLISTVMLNRFEPSRRIRVVDLSYFLRPPLVNIHDGDPVNDRSQR